jgi:hypothetical protein
MLRHLRIIRQSARRIASAANHAVDDYSAGQVEHEPDFTSQMLGRMKEAMHGYRVRGVLWTAKVLTSAGTASQETELGADFVEVLEFNLPDYQVKKGFLAQAKRIEKGKRLVTREWDRLVEQCTKMLSISNMSFVFIYSRAGVSVVPALAIKSATGPTNLNDFYPRTLVRFYEDHFECRVGDPRISSADIETLKHIKARNELHLSASPTQLTFDMETAEAAPF